MPEPSLVGRGRLPGFGRCQVLRTRRPTGVDPATPTRAGVAVKRHCAGRRRPGRGVTVAVGAGYCLASRTAFRFARSRLTARLAAAVTSGSSRLRKRPEAPSPTNVTRVPAGAGSNIRRPTTERRRHELRRMSSLLFGSYSVTSSVILSRRGGAEAPARTSSRRRAAPPTSAVPRLRPTPTAGVSPTTPPLCRRAREGESKESRGEGGRPVTPDEVVNSD